MTDQRSTYEACREGLSLEPAITIVTANFNSGMKLLETVRSTKRNGTYIEHIIVDGASTDCSAQLGEALASENPHVSWVSAPDDGIYDALNKGLLRARGKYLLFLGAGDQLITNPIECLVKSLPNDTNRMIYGNVRWGSRIYGGEFTLARLRRANICQQAIFYGRELFTTVGKFNLQYRILSDWDFNIRCFLSDRVLTQYVPAEVSRFEEGGISSKDDAGLAQERRQIVRTHFGLGSYVIDEAHRCLGRARTIAGAKRRDLLSKLRGR